MVLPCVLLHWQAAQLGYCKVYPERLEPNPEGSQPLPLYRFLAHARPHAPHVLLLSFLHAVVCRASCRAGNSHDTACFHFHAHRAGLM